MSKVEQLEREIEALSAPELAALREWFVALDAEAWDRQIEADALSGRLDTLADAALAEHRAGASRPI